MRCIRFLSTMLLCGGGGEGGKLSSMYMLSVDTRRSDTLAPTGCDDDDSKPLGGGESRQMYDLLLSPASNVKVMSFISLVSLICTQETYSV